MQSTSMYQREDEILRLLGQFARLNSEEKPKDQTKIPAFHAVMPETIRCCPSVHDFHAKREIVPISLAEFVQKKSLKGYNPSLTMTESQIQKVWSDTTLPKKHVTEIEEELHDPHYTDRFVVVNMGEMGDGLFLAHDVKPIKAGSIVLTYSGKYKVKPLEDQTDDSDYVLAIPTPFENERKSVLLNKETAQFVDAKHGNLARFVQGGLGLQDFIGNNKIDGKKKVLNKAAFPNLTERVVVYRGFPVIALQSLRDIMPGEMLRYSYGAEYFGGLRNITQLVTDDLGRVFAKVVKGTLVPILTPKEISRLPDAQRIDISELKKIRFTPFTKEEMVFDYQKQFYHSVCHALSVASTMLTHSKHHKFLEVTLAEFQKIDNPSDQFNRVQEYIRMPLFKDDDLTSVRMHLVNIVMDFVKVKNQQGKK